MMAKHSTSNACDSMTFDFATSAIFHLHFKGSASIRLFEQTNCCNSICCSWCRTMES